MKMLNTRNLKNEGNKMATSNQQPATSNQQPATSNQQKNGGFLGIVKHKPLLNLRRHPVLDTGSRATNSGRDYFPRSPRKAGMVVYSKAAFTLVELAIVLVIIGLVVGGVLVGRDLISAAEIRSQISQIEKYNVAANTFKIKYGYLPGDIPEPHASGFGFKARGAGEGTGDGNGVIQGAWNPLDNEPSAVGSVILCGETGMFWVDLSTANLIDGSFNILLPNAYPATNTALSEAGNGSSNTLLKSYFPKAKIGANYVHVWSGGYFGQNNRKNYFGIMPSTAVVWSSSFISQCGTVSYPMLSSAYPMTVNQAYNIDAKIDDGLPQSGKVTTQLVSQGFPVWASGSWGVPSTAATDASSTTCFDNSNSATVTGVAGQPQHYSLGVGSTPNSQNCTLSFEFQ